MCEFLWLHWEQLAVFFHNSVWTVPLKNLCLDGHEAQTFHPTHLSQQNRDTLPLDMNVQNEGVGLSGRGEG